MKDILFIVTLAVHLLLGFSIVWSILSPHKRIWPPPAKRSWQYWFTWVLTVIAFLGTIVLGILDYNSFIFNHPVFLPVGIVIAATGIFIGLRGVCTIGMKASSGQKAVLRTDGIYTWTRNPQYLGDILLIIGCILVFNSILATITAGLGALWFLLAPLSEEPWLKKQYGNEYEEYCRRVGRWISLRSLIETVYLLHSSPNRKHLKKSMEQIEKNETITVKI